MSTRQRWTTAKYIEFIDAWETDSKIEEVAEKFGITAAEAQRRHQHLRKQGVQLRNKGKLGGVDVGQLKAHLKSIQSDPAQTALPIA